MNSEHLMIPRSKKMMEKRRKKFTMLFVSKLFT
jgi:hypothetical protein